MFKKKYYYLLKFKSISKIRFNDSSGTDDEDDWRKCGPLVWTENQQLQTSINFLDMKIAIWQSFENVGRVSNLNGGF